jgi:hypothetical protein
MDVNYLIEFGKWEAKQEFAEAETRRTVEAQAKTTQAKIADFERKALEAFSGEWPEPFRDLVGGRHGVLPASLSELILDSEDGVKVAEYLANDLGEYRRIAALPAHIQGREIGKIEAKLASPPEAKPAPKSKAPAPPEQMARGAGGRFAVPPDTDDFAAFEKQYGP